MFQSIKYLDFNYDRGHFWIYEAIDTDFKCIIRVPQYLVERDEFLYLFLNQNDDIDTMRIKRLKIYDAVAAGLLSLQYIKRRYSHQDIANNLLRCNLYLSEKHKCSFEEIVNIQSIHVFDRKHKLLYKAAQKMYDVYKMFL